MLLVDNVCLLIHWGLKVCQQETTDDELISDTLLWPSGRHFEENNNKTLICLFNFPC